ncbi:MAG: bifunctional diaminohydroxyphosphoribosylaminopyrimidine deaminase/5-amino-6-(5-phosphoribosylamino)uracil reductase RibD [Planctomycetia bacterium]
MAGERPEPIDEPAAMRHALRLARRGEGSVEPNPQVGAVVLSAEGKVVGEGWHARFGGPHAEIVALAEAGAAARGGTLVVTLEPCCHHGKTPPCTDAVIAAGLARVVVATADPFPAVAGAGIDRLRTAGIDVDLGTCAAEARRLIAPFRRLVVDGRPWVIAKRAMSLDGRIATTAGDARWISGEASRALVHALRGRMDAILVGIGTALADDPLLTARPSGPRRALRVVVDSRARLPAESRLVLTAREAPLLVAVGPDAAEDRVAALRAAGAEVWRGSDGDRAARLVALLAHLGDRRVTNLLVEGGEGVLGGFLDAGLIDEAWAFVAPKLLGGVSAPAAIGGRGASRVDDGAAIVVEDVLRVGDDLLVRGTRPEA